MIAAVWCHKIMIIIAAIGLAVIVAFAAFCKAWVERIQSR